MIKDLRQILEVNNYGIGKVSSLKENLRVRCYNVMGSFGQLNNALDQGFSGILEAY